VRNSSAAGGEKGIFTTPNKIHSTHQIDTATGASKKRKKGLHLCRQTATFSYLS
jgi:hypothetical protein